jgi:hypothetical protein
MIVLTTFAGTTFPSYYFIRKKHFYQWCVKN